MRLKITDISINNHIGVKYPLSVTFLRDMGAVDSYRAVESYCNPTPSSLARLIRVISKGKIEAKAVGRIGG